MGRGFESRRGDNDSGCSAVGSVPRSGRGGRKFESSHPDVKYYG